MKLSLASSSNSFKSYEDYRCITDKSSKQYKLIHSNEIHISSDGLLRTNDGYIGIALGSFYSKDIGEKFIITFDNGNKVKFITIDHKADKDTINGANHKSDFSMIEFVIDTDKAKRKYKKAIQMGNFNYANQFQGNIIRIEKVVE